MVNVTKLIARDLQHVWHPCSQMKDFESCPPLVVERAQGSYLYTNQGPIIDAISSWWCKSLGHGHPNVLAAIQEQLLKFEHIIGANTTHEPLVALAEELAQITGNQHVFFASDGATAVEIAMKLAIHAAQIKGYSNRNQFVALKNAYHGESFATMSVSDLGIYKAPYSSINVDCYFIQEMPYVANQSHPLWDDCDSYWQLIEPKLNAIKDKVCAVLIEPIIQGAAGLRCYSADFVRRLASWARVNDIYLIADEIMTGIGRTGTWLACDHAGVRADMVCLSKGLTSGALPLSCVVLSHAVFDLFYADKDSGKSFLHSNTYSCNALAVAAALATIHTIKSQGILEQANSIGTLMTQSFHEISKHTGKLENIRGIGAVVAADLIGVNPNKLYQRALALGALIRPIGNTLYWLPPLNTDKETIEKLTEITLKSILDSGT